MREVHNEIKIALNHGTIIWTEIACKKIPCYMHDLACRWLIVENAKVFRSYVNIFESSHVKEIVESWLVYVNKSSRIIQSCFLSGIIKQS